MISAEAAQVSLLGDALRSFRGDSPAGDDLDFGIVEALNNVVEHGHGGGADARIELIYQEYTDRVLVEILDRGLSMPPSKLEEADGRVFNFNTTDTMTLPEGGMGLALIRALFDKVDYVTKSGVNRLRLCKLLRHAAGGPHAQ